MTPSDWRPSASIDILARRAGLLRCIRAFMHERGVLEVETPVLSRAATADPNIQSLQARVNRPHTAAPVDVYLHTSPEFAMKRLLAAGSGSIYQVCKVFRDYESGQQHQPEFTMLEWYRTGFDQHRLMGEIAELLQALGLPVPERTTYAKVFNEHTGLCPHTAPDAELDRRARQSGLIAAGSDRGVLLDFLFNKTVAPQLPASGAFVTDYPAGQAALARIAPGPPPVAERFELFLAGMEIANGFHELCDSEEQRRRFAAENARRRERGLPVVPVDERLLAALASGLPDCAGVALGIDRLLMVLTGSIWIDDVLAVPFDRS